MRRFRLLHYLMTSLWFVPVLFVAGALGLSILTTVIDDGNVVPQKISGDPNAAMQILYLIAFSMLTLTGLVLSLVVVVVQLAMGVFSPRIVRQILQDRPSQVAIGLFAGTFAYAILAIREIRTTRNGGSVPGLAVVIALCLVIVCIATLLWYVDHIGQSLRVAALVGWVADDTISTLDQMYPEHGGTPEPADDLILSPRGGVIFKVDPERMVGIAESAGCRLALLKGIGDFVPIGSPLVRVSGDRDALSERRVLACIALGPERTLNEDVAYGIRMLVDIALSSLSAGGFGDPTTAVEAIDRLHEVLRRLATRSLPPGRFADAHGEVRVVLPTTTWDGYVRLTFDEIRQAGAGSLQVTRRLTAALDDLLAMAPPDRRDALQHQRRLLHEMASSAAPTLADRRAALIADDSGIGSSADLVTNAPSLAEHPAAGPDGSSPRS